MALQVRQRPAADGERLLAEAGHSSLIRASDLGRRRIRRWRRQDGRRLLDRQRRQARSTWLLSEKFRLSLSPIRERVRLSSLTSRWLNAGGSG